MKYGLLTFPRSENAGDAIQSIAAMQFLPRIDVLLDREGMNRVAAAPRGDIAVIGNAWYAHNVDNWPPSPAIRLLPISIHMSPRATESYLSERNIDYLRSLSPIGARDEFTRKQIAARGVETYLSGCLTLALESPVAKPARETIVTCDIGERALAFVRATARHPVRELTHAERLGREIDDKFLRARRLLLEYAQARCVITTRLHAALPALAYGTPVYLIEDVDDAYRFEGLREHLWHGSEEDFIGPSGGFDINTPPANPGTHHSLRSSLVRRVQAFVADSAPAILQPSWRGPSSFGTTKDGEPGDASRSPSRGFAAIQRTDAVMAAELAAARARANVLEDELAGLRSRMQDLQLQLSDAQSGLTELARIKAANAQLASEVETARGESSMKDVRIRELESASNTVAAELAEARMKAVRIQELENASQTTAAELAAMRDSVVEIQGWRLEARRAEMRLKATAEERLQLRDSVWRLQQDLATAIAAKTQASHALEASQRRLDAVPWKAVRVYRGVTRFVPRPLVFLLASLVRNPKNEP